MASNEPVVEETYPSLAVESGFVVKLNDICELYAPDDQLPYVGVVQQLYKLQGEDDKRIDVVWLYRSDEVFDMIGGEDPRKHPKEVWFSVHYDDPGVANDLVLRKPSVLFFSKPPDLTNALIRAELDKVDYFCCQTLHHSAAAPYVENNAQARKTEGEFKRMFQQMKSWCTRGDAIIAEIDLGVRAPANVDDAGLFDDEKSSKTKKKQSFSSAVSKSKTTAVKMELEDENINIFDDDENSLASDVYEVEQIVDDRRLNGQKQYFIKWKGYRDSDNTWEGPENCATCKYLIRSYIFSKYKSNPHELERQKRDFDTFYPTAERVAHIENTVGGGVMQRDLANNVVLLKGTASVYGGASDEDWMIANLYASGGGAPRDRKRNKNPPPMPDTPYEGRDVQEVWHDQLPTWIQQVTQFKKHDAGTCRQHFESLSSREPRALEGSWTRDNNFHNGGKMWFTAMGWAILERAEGPLQALLQMHDASLLTSPCSGDVNDIKGKTAVDPLFLASWHARKDSVKSLLEVGASPFSENVWSGVSPVIPLEIALVFYYMNFGGLVNRDGVRRMHALDILEVLKSTISPGKSLLHNALYNPRLSPEDDSTQAGVVRLFQEWIQRHTILVAAGVDSLDPSSRQTARRTGGRKLRTAPKAAPMPTPGDLLERQSRSQAEAPKAAVPKAYRKDAALDDDVLEGLRGLGIMQYADVLRENGYLTMMDLKLAKETDLRNLGVKTFHVQKIYTLATNAAAQTHGTKRGFE